MRISLNSVMFLFVIFGMGVSITLLARERNKLKRQRDAVVLFNQDLSDEMATMRALVEESYREFKKVRDENQQVEANAKRSVVEAESARDRIEMIAEEVIEEIESELKDLRSKNEALRDEVAALRTEKANAAR